MRKTSFGPGKDWRGVSTTLDIRFQKFPRGLNAMLHRLARRNGMATTKYIISVLWKHVEETEKAALAVPKESPLANILGRPAFEDEEGS